MLMTLLSYADRSAHPTNHRTSQEREKEIHFELLVSNFPCNNLILYHSSPHESIKNHSGENSSTEEDELFYPSDVCILIMIVRPYSAFNYQIVPIMLHFDNLLSNSGNVIDHTFIPIACK